MYNKVESWIDLVELEHGILRFWEENCSFEKLRKKNQGGKRWSFLDGPITANNPMGVHHAMGRSLKDMFQRYWAMNGYELRYQNGYDCQGLWIEVEVEKEHGFSSKQQIEDFGIGRFVEECKARAKKFSEIITKQSIRLGYWMDWNNSYYTMSDENNYTIWSFLKKCHERGKIYRGTDVMPWSGRSGSGYSHMEVIEGRRLVAHDALFLKFPLRGRVKENLLLWTTTPWTLTSNVAAMVNADLEYVRLRCRGDGELYYFASENLNFKRLERQYSEKKEWIEGVQKLKTIAEVFEERGGFEIEGYLKGSEMIGWEYDGPFDELEAQDVAGGYPFADENISLSGKTAHRVIDGGRDNRGNPVVVAGEGTGIVHTAPGCGEIDHVVGKRLGLPQIAPLDSEAKFLEKFGPLKGKHALADETVGWIMDSLKGKGLLIHVERYPHVYPHCWRSGDPLVFRLVDEWYINMDWRDEIKGIVGDIRWIPAFGAEREMEWLANMRDWMISKKRYWGLALPIWECAGCGHFDVIGGKQELAERAVEGWGKFEGKSPHRPWIDEVKIRCDKCGGAASRIPDVGNPWLDAGIVPYSTVNYNTDRKYWKRWFPADIVLECFPGQFRNWFYSLLAMSTMMEGRAPFRTLVGHALVLDERGQEMHKSSGNVIWFDDAVEKMGADIMRWIFCSHEYDTSLHFGYNIANEVRGKFYNTLWNTYSFFINYARLDEFLPSKRPSRISKRPDFDRWIMSELHVVVKEVRQAIEGFDSQSACHLIEGFVEGLSNWYVRLNRRRFWKSGSSSDKTMAYETLYECLHALTRLIAPMMPFTAEEMYQNLVRSHDKSMPESVHHCDYPDAAKSAIDEELNEDMRAVKRLTSLALSAREAARIKVRQPLASLAIGPADRIERRSALRFSKLICSELNVKEAVVNKPGTPSPKIPIRYVVKPNLKTLGKRLKGNLKRFKDMFPNFADRLAKEYSQGKEAFAVVVDGSEITIGRGDLLAREQAQQDVAFASDGETWVSLDTEITNDLRIEGMMREALRSLQVQRKKEGLELDDRIKVVYSTESNDISEVFRRYEEYLKSELLAKEIGAGDVKGGVGYNLGGATVRIRIEKA